MLVVGLCGLSVGCGEGEVGEAQLTWIAGAQDAPDGERRVSTWAFVGGEGSRFEEGGTFVHVDVPLPRDAHGQLQLDLPPPGVDEPSRLRYWETDHGRVVFDGNALSGAVRVTGVADGCACAGGAFELLFVDPGPDGRAGTDDDLRRALRDATYAAGDDGCRPARLASDQIPVDRIEVTYTEACDPRIGNGESVMRGGAVWDGRRETRSSTTVVIFYEPQPLPAPGPPTRDDRFDDDSSSGCAGDDSRGGCESDDNGGGCSSDDSGGGCDGDDSGGGCGGDDSSGGCDGDDSSGGCDGDGGGCDADVMSAAGPAPCRLRRRRSLSSGAQNCLLIGLALCAQGSLRGRRKRLLGRSAPERDGRSDDGQEHHADPEHDREERKGTEVEHR